MNKEKLYKGKIVRHFKGNLYIVLDICYDTRTEEALILYKALYGDYKLLVRPIAEFFEEVPKDKPNPTGQKYRFEILNQNAIY